MDKVLPMKTYAQLRRTLTETPLPDAWDKSIFNTTTPFEDQVEYAKVRASQIGSGSARVAFIIPYEGRDTVLKIAKNQRGHGQNEAEASIMSSTSRLSPMAKRFIVPMIDYDNTSRVPTWIHTEYGTPVTDKDFINKYGEWPGELMEYVNYGLASKQWNDPNHVHDYPDIVRAVCEIRVVYDVVTDDLSLAENWGMYRGQFVIIDLGLTEKVWSDWYT